MMEVKFSIYRRKYWSIRWTWLARFKTDR